MNPYLTFALGAICGALALLILAEVTGRIGDPDEPQTEDAP